MKYAIRLDNSSEPLWCSRRQLSIKEADAKRLRAEFNPSLAGPKPADVSWGKSLKNKTFAKLGISSSVLFGVLNSSIVI